MKPRNKTRLYIYNRDDKECVYCNKKITFKQMTIDHYLPLSKGGTNDIFNLVTCCKKCNKLKGDSVPLDFKARILGLFIMSVNDNMILGENLKVDNKTLKEYLLEVNRIEDITEEFIFQSDNMRFYIKDNTVYRIIHLGGKNEYNSNFSWKD